MNEQLVYYKTPTFFQDAPPITMAEDVREEMQRGKPRIITTSQAYNNAGFRAESWSRLANQVVGGEED